MDIQIHGPSGSLIYFFFNIDSRTSRHEISEDVTVKSAVTKFNLIDAHRTLPPTVTGFTFSNAHETYTQR